MLQTSIVMLRRLRRVNGRQGAAALLVTLLWASLALAQFPAQRPQGYVNDLAGVLTPAGRQRIEALCRELDVKAKAQLAVVTVRSLEGRPLEDFTVDLAQRWGIGPRGTDRGAMLFLAIDDRESRIEVAYGLEPVITDGRAGSILRSMVPYLQQGDYDGALWLGASSIAQPIAQEAGVTLAPLAAQAPSARPSVPPWVDTVLGEWLPVILFAIFAVIFISPLILMLLPKRWRKKMGGFGNWTDSNRRGGWHGGSWSGGGSGWSGGGGGGFGGFGGGSFGGGGASGKW